MKNALEQLLSELQQRHIKLWVEGESLRYQAPKEALTPSLKAQLAEHKAALLSIFAQVQEHQSTQLPLLERRASQEVVPLSFAQQRLWFIDQLEGSNAIYNIPLALRLVGNLHLRALEQSLTEIMQRHEVLRTTIQTVEGQPRVAKTSASLKLEVLTGTAAAIPQLLSEEAQGSFDLATGPLLRAKLWKLGDQEHVLSLNMHHIVADGWSIGVLLYELTVLYNSFCQEKPSPLPPLAIQYADFAHWQRQWLTGANLAKQVNYWKPQLAGAPALLELPTDRPRPAMQRFHGASFTFQLPPDCTHQLQQLSQQTNVTLFMTLLAAFATLLSRYSGVEDLVIGSPIANRTQTVIEPLIGFFVNTLALRINLTGNPSFQELLQRVKQVATNAYAHQDLPFEKLVEELQVERTLSHAPLFQVLFALQKSPLGSLELTDLTATRIVADNPVAKFDLTLELLESAQQIEAVLEYNTDLFDLATIKRMAGHFEMLLAGIVYNPQQPVQNLPLLTPAEQEQLQSWNQTQTDYPQDQTIVELFQAQVVNTPENIAVVFEKQQLNYQQLNTKANQLAHYLISLGVQAETLVGICVERSLDMVVGLLGILKAGGAYVPLDPDYPAERLQFMLEDAAVPVLLSQSHLRERLPTHQTVVIELDGEWEQISSFSGENLERRSGPMNLAYVIYTSGSTGKPKGAMNTLQGIGNRLLWMQDAYQLTPADNVLQKTPFSFDVSVWELFWPLLVGARLTVAKPGGHQDRDYLINLIMQQQITILHFVPAMLQVFLQDTTLKHGHSLKRVICSGEELAAELTARFFTQLPTVELHNLYGPTEAAVDVTYWACQPHTKSQRIPIGRPVANTQIYVLEHSGQVAPLGIPGELHIGGIQVARGYLNRPDLTAEKFVELELFGQRQRVYKTGDRARYLSNGDIEYLGRLDNQVKIRGFRIELGEIETRLAQHPAVRENVVMLRSDFGHPQLVAYLVPHSPDQQSSTRDLRSFLKTKLPEYMIPAAFIWLDQFPLTPNGKVDYRALPPVESSNSVIPTRAAGREELTETEQRLLEIWSSVLKRTSIDIHDNFFELGGDSILSIQTIARANQMGLQFTPKQLFQHQTIAELATVVNTQRQQRTIEQGLVTGTVPLTPIQHGFFAQSLPAPHHYNQSLLLEVSPAFTQAHLEAILKTLLQQHDALRLRFPTDQLPQISDDCSLVIIRGEETELEALATELQASLNLSAGPIMRVAFFPRDNSQSNLLLLIIHHLVIDGVSWRILLDDLTTAYQQLQRGEAITLPPKTTSFKYWAERLSEYALSPALLAELPYWIAIVRHHVPPLPVDYLACCRAADPKSPLRSVNLVASEQHFTVSLTKAQTEALLQQVPFAYNTQINDVLLTALVQSFAEWTGQATLLVDLEGHGREELFEEVDLTRTTGWFTTLFPVILHIDLSTPQMLGDVLKSIKEQLRQIPQRGIGYGILKYLSQNLGGDTSISSAEVSFNYLGQIDQAFSGEPLRSLFNIASSAAERSLSNPRTHLLDITGVLKDGQLQVTYSYSQDLHRRTTIEQLAQNFLIALIALITHCQSRQEKSYTPSDFPEAKLSQAELDKLLTQIN